MPVEMVTRCIRQDGDERGMLVYGYEFQAAYEMVKRIETVKRSPERAQLYRANRSS